MTRIYWNFRSIGNTIKRLNISTKVEHTKRNFQSNHKRHLQPDCKTYFKDGGKDQMNFEKIYKVHTNDLIKAGLAAKIFLI